MGLLSFVALALLAATQESAAATDAASAVTVPPAQATPAPAAVPAPVQAADPVPPVKVEEKAVAIPAQDPPRERRPLEDRVTEAGPSLGGFMVGSVAVVGLLGGALLLLRRFGKNSRLLGNGGPIRVLARRSVAPKQEVLLIEVGGRVVLVGSTREHLSALGEFRGPDEVAALRAQLPELRSDFRESLREGLHEAQEAPREERVFASIADELAEIRKTVRAWRA